MEIHKLLESFRLYLLKLGQEENTVKSNIKYLRKLYTECSPFTVENFSQFIDNLILSSKTKSYISKYIYVIHHWGNFQNIPEFSSYPMPKLRNKSTFIRETMSATEIETFITLPYPGKTRGKYEKKWSMWSMFWKVQAWTGMRPSEVARLTLDDVDFGLGVFKVRKTKTGSPRVIPINSVIWEDVEHYINRIPFPRTLLFPNFWKPDQPVNSGGWRENFNKRIQLMNLRREGIVSYSLRHSLPSRLIKNSSIYDVQRIMGHKKITTTEKYLHTDLESLTETINNDPMGEMHKTAEDQYVDIQKLLRNIEIKYFKNFHTNIISSPDGSEIHAIFQKREKFSK